MVDWQAGKEECVRQLPMLNLIHAARVAQEDALLSSSFEPDKAS